MDALSEIVRIRVSADDKAAWEAQAARVGMSLATWCRVTLKRGWREETGSVPTVEDGSRASNMIPSSQDIAQMTQMTMHGSLGSKR